MGILRRIADRFDPPQAELETRAQEVSWNALREGWDATGASTSPRAAENLSTVLACVGAISSAMASLPTYVYRRLDRGREVDERHPVARLIANGPNDKQTWPDWCEWTLASALLRGNALSEIVTDARGAVVELRPIPWEFVRVVLLMSGRLAYDITETTTIYGGTGRSRRLLQDEVFHLRDRSDDGLVGRSRLQRAAAVVSTGVSMQTFADSMFRNGINPSGALQVEGKLTDEQLARLSNQFRSAFAGPTKAARAMILDSGTQWKQISISPEDGEFLASRKFSVEELARLYNCPPPIIGALEHGTFSNTETMVRFFATNTLTPWARKLEAEFGRSVFGGRTHQLEVDLSGLLRGDPAQRWAAWQIAAEANILTADEIREVEGWNPRATAAAA